MSNEPTVERGQRPQQRINARAQAEREPEHETTHEALRARTRTRMLSSGPSTHDSYINLRAIPKDVSLEWKRFSVAGEEYPFYLEEMRQQGWEPVNPQEHPDWVRLPPGYDAVTVIVNGQILMERPMSLTLEAREDDRILAGQRMEENEKRLGKRQNDTEAERSKPKIIKEMGRMVSQAIEE